MPDEQSPEANLSKRERQKARRAQRLEAERAAAASAKRRRLAVFAVVGVLIVGAAGYFVQQNLAERAEEREIIQAGQENLDELGCTPVEEMPPLGAGHFEQAQLAANPPEAIYDHLPATSGQHIGQVVVTGVYDEYVDERLLVHNQEHGYVVMWYDEDADPDQVEALKAFAQERIDDGDAEIIVAPYNQPMDDEANFAFAAWERRQLCEEFDEGVALGFVTEHMDNQRAPETFAGPHLGGQPGEVDPATDPAVFPPLAEGGAQGGPRIDQSPVDDDEAADPDAETEVEMGDDDEEEGEDASGS
ncbi:MAG: DUF3105 domain-containing protein [Egibacteraceae bacterium]